MSVQVVAASSLRYTPQWFWRYSRSGFTASRVTLCTHCPNSGLGSGRNTAETPELAGAQLAPPSLVRKTPAVDTATVTDCGSRSSVRTVCSPSPPPPGTHWERVGCSQSGRTSSKLSPRSSERYSAAGSVPA